MVVEVNADGRALVGEGVVRRVESLSVDVDGEGSCDAADVELSVRSDVAGGIDIAVVPDVFREGDANGVAVGGISPAFWSCEIES